MRGSKEKIVAACEATWQLLVRGKVCSNSGGGLEEQEKVYKPGAQIRRLYHAWGKAKLNLVDGTSLETNKVIKQSLNSSLVATIGIGG